MDATQIILIVFIVLLIIIYPIMISARNKKENQRMQEQTNSLKRGDRVLTTSGVYGTIVDLQLEGDKKIVTIESGTDSKKGYISVDAYAIYTIFKDDEQKEEPAMTANLTQPDQKEQELKENVSVTAVSNTSDAQANTKEQPAQGQENIDKKEPKKKEKKKML